MILLFSILLILVACVVVWRASEGFEVASNYLGRNLSDGVRGATINAIGSSTPELFTTLFFFYYYYFLGDPDQANNGFAGGIGTTAGSAIFNGMIIPAVVILAVIYGGVVSQITVSRRVILRDGLSLIAAEIVLIALLSGYRLDWYHGLILMLIYGIYATVMFTTMRGKAEVTDDGNFYENPAESRRWRQLITLDLASFFVSGKIGRRSAWSLLLGSTLVIGLACFLLVYACELGSAALGINTYFVAVILASAATSVPDTILSYRDAMDGEYDDAVANALGSNIFDVCFALGFPLFLFTLLHGPLDMDPAIVEDITELRVLLLSLTVLAFLVYVSSKRLGRTKAFILIGMYLLFTGYIFGKAYGYEWAIAMGEYLRSWLV